MTEEKIKLVLRLVQENKITVEEGYHLISEPEPLVFTPNPIPDFWRLYPTTPNTQSYPGWPYYQTTCEA